MWKELLCVLLFLLSIGQVKAQQVFRNLSVEELFHLGMENSVRLRSMRTQEAVAEEQRQTARMDMLPEIQVGVEGGIIGQPIVFRRGLAHPTRPETPDWSQNYSVNLEQPIYQGGRIRHSIRRSEIRKNIARLDTEGEEDDIRLSLLRQYMDLFTLYKQKEVLARNIEESERRLKDIRRLREEGVLTRNDELRSELEKTNDSLDYQVAEDQIAIVSQRLDILLGLDEALTLVPDTALLDTVYEKLDLDSYIQIAYDHYSGMRIAEENTQLAQMDLKIAKADLLPSVSLQAGNTLARPIRSSMEDLYNNNWSIGLNISYNLSSLLYKNKHRLREARLNVQLRRDEEELMRQNIRTEVRSAYIRHLEAENRVKALRLSVNQANENYRIVHNRYFNQLSILTDLLDATSVRLEAEMRLVSAKVEAVYTYFELQHICGML